MAKAMEFILRGRVVDPETALNLGIISELVDGAVLRAGEIASDLAAMPAIGLARAKKTIYEGSETHLDGGLEMENSAFVDVMLSGETQRVVQRYLDLPVEERRGWVDHPTYAKGRER